MALSTPTESQDNSDESVDDVKFTLESLPEPIIGITASYLNQSEYDCFSRYAKWIYSACNSPNCLHELDLQVSEGTRVRTINLIQPFALCKHAVPDKFTHGLHSTGVNTM